MRDATVRTGQLVSSSPRATFRDLPKTLADYCSRWATSSFMPPAGSKPAIGQSMSKQWREKTTHNPSVCNDLLSKRLSRRRASSAGNLFPSKPRANERKTIANDLFSFCFCRSRTAVEIVAEMPRDRWCQQVSKTSCLTEPSGPRERYQSPRERKRVRERGSAGRLMWSKVNYLLVDPLALMLSCNDTRITGDHHEPRGVKSTYA